VIHVPTFRSHYNELLLGGSSSVNFQYEGREAKMAFIAIVKALAAFTAHRLWTSMDVTRETTEKAKEIRDKHLRDSLDALRTAK